MRDLVTLSGYFVLNSVFIPICLVSDRAIFESNCMKTNKDRHILLVMQIFGRDSIFWQYKIYTDIRADSVEKKASKDGGVVR